MGQIRAAGDRATQATRSGRGPEIVLDRWIARLEATAVKPRPALGDGARDPNPRPPTVAEREPVESAGLSATISPRARDVAGARSGGQLRGRIEARGSSVVFSDAVGGTIVLGRSGDRIVHLGTVAVRGPYGLTLGVLRRHGLTEIQARGVEFVAAWFGAPFDAITVNRAEGGRSLSWGFWPLGPAEIGRALALWKERSPTSFTELLGDHGFDVVRHTEQDLAGPELTVAGPRNGSLLRGDRALDAIARDARCAALLARAGRHDEAKAAQLEVALRPVLSLLRMSVTLGKERTPIGTVAVSARAVAALVIASRALDLPRLAEILGALALDPGADAEAKLIGGVVSALAETRTSAALAAQRTVSSPELGAL